MGRAPQRLAKIYIRVSTTRGREELYSPEIQEAAARAKAAQEGLKVLDVVFDLNRSGRDFARRKIADMIEEVRRGEYEVVLLWKWSRFGRNLRESLNNLHELEQAGGYAVSATEPGDSKTTLGRFSRNQMLSIAELQSDLIGDSWRDVHEYRLANGLPHNGGRRFGYVYENREYKPEPVRSDALAEFYERYVAGDSMRSIVLDMAEAGVRAFNGDILDDRRWLSTLDTGFAAGLIRKRKPGKTGRSIDNWEWIPGAHEPIISMDLWEAYLAKRRAGGRTGNRKAKYGVSGLLKCAECGRMMVATQTSRREILFRCLGFVTQECSSSPTVLKATVEAVILDWLEKQAQGMEKVEDWAQQEAKKAKRETEVAQLKAVVDDLNRKLGRLLDLYEDGVLDKAEYNRRREEREAERSKAQQRLAELGEDQTSPPPPPEFYQGVRDSWAVISEDRKRQMLRKVIEHVIVRKRGCTGERFTIVPKFV